MPEDNNQQQTRKQFRKPLLLSIPDMQTIARMMRDCELTDIENEVYIKLRKIISIRERAARAREERQAVNE